jgi:protoheme IX farnesyltransferase
MSHVLRPSNLVSASLVGGRSDAILQGIREFSQLTKFTISFTATLTAATGYLAALRHVHPGLATMLAGTLMLAMGASAINEAQECHFDAQMARTRLRPIPSGRMSRSAGWRIGSALAGTGFLVLFATQGLLPALLGLLALAWYGGVYTPLKRKTAFAVLPGALIGALPPAIGWASTGAGLASLGLLSLCLFFFIWQVPHFWMLMMIHDKDYGKAGFPVLSGRFPRDKGARLAFTWVAATALSCAFMPLFGVIASVPMLAVLPVAATWLVWTARDLLRPDPGARVFRRTFWHLNLYALLVLLAVVLDPFLGP